MAEKDHGVERLIQPAQQRPCILETSQQQFARARERVGLRDGSFRRLDGYWTAPHNEISIGDVPPQSFGCAALNLRGSIDDAHQATECVAITDLVALAEVYERWLRPG